MIPWKTYFHVVLWKIFVLGVGGAGTTSLYVDLLACSLWCARHHHSSIDSLSSRTESCKVLNEENFASSLATY